MLKELGEHKKAMSHFQKAIEIKPNFENAHYNLGVAFEGLNEFQKQKIAFSKQLKLILII